MSYSLNEIDGLSKKAARGAGFSWGMAEEAGKAVRWLASFDLAGPSLFAALLSRNDGAPHTDFAPQALSGVLAAQRGLMCPLASGVVLCDSADQILQGGEIALQDVMYPLLVLPFAASAATYFGRPVQVMWDAVCVDISPTGICVVGPRSDLNASETSILTCKMSEGSTGNMQASAWRGDIDAATWAMLNAFAHRTYAPATEESRILGAGAGIADND